MLARDRAGAGMVGARIAAKRTTVLLVVSSLSTACGAAAQAPEPTTATDADVDLRGARRPGPHDDPFVWERAEVAAHLDLRESGGLGPARFETADGVTCEVSIRTSAMEVHLARANGRRVVTNARETVGVEVVGPPPDPPQPSDLGATAVEVEPACYGALPEDLDDLEPWPRDDGARRADLDALDDELREAAEDHVPGTVDEGWWPGLDISVSEDTVTLSGYSLGRCRIVTVARDGAVTDPSAC